MSHPTCDRPGIRYHPRMRTRLVIASVLSSAVTLIAASCSSKPAASQDPGQKPIAAETGQRVMVPGADTAATGAPRMTMGAPAGDEGGAAKSAAPTSVDDAFRLKPEEGTLTIQAPTDAKAGTESVATIVVTPDGPYKINTEFPTKLTLETPEGVTIAKATYKAGGHDKAKGDADAFTEKQLAFSVKLTPAASGTHTINGTFKFAVCDKDVCLAKKELISIAVAAK